MCGELGKRRIPGLLAAVMVCCLFCLLSGGCEDDSPVSEEERGVQFLKFYADWCGPCHTQAPIVDRLVGDYRWVKFSYINIDTEPQMADQYRVNAIPCLVIVVNGREKKRFVGVQSYERLAGELNKFARYAGGGN